MTATRLRAALLALGLLAAGAAGARAQGSARRPGFAHFITASGAHLMDGAAPFRFISFNIPNLNFVEDEFAFTRAHEYRLPDEFELRDAFESVRQMGGTAIRMYTFPVRTEGDPADLPRYVLAPGKFDETSFRDMDLVLALANEYGIRLIVPLLNNWQWMGGRPQYAAFRGKESDAFWTDPQLIADFEETVKYVLNRRNTITGVVYKDDPAILCWETGNELTAPQSWTDEIARFIKSIDRRHLVMDGFGAGGGRTVNAASVANPNIDILSSHHYERDPNQVIAHIDANRAVVGGRKPYVVGEVGFIGTAGMRVIFDDIIRHDDVAGALGWSLRYHRREGGFYWHSEPGQSNAAYEIFKAYHVPGFASGDDYDEHGFLAMMRAAAFRIRGLGEPAWKAPAAPVLLPIEDVAGISWRGSVAAAGYDVQRAASPTGPWRTVGLNVSDAELPYTPAFADASAQVGQSYWYRIVALNQSGRSAPSNVVGPVAVRTGALVDDMRSLSTLYRTSGKVAVVTGEDRRFKEDRWRVQGDTAATLVYAAPGPIAGVTVYAFTEGKGPALEFALSDDGLTFTPASVARAFVGPAGSVYGYWLPELYRQTFAPGAARFVRIRFAEPAQIGRVEVRYGSAEAVRAAPAKAGTGR